MPDAGATPASSAPVLVVDLDGSLLRSDTLYETLWSAIGQDAKATFSMIGHVLWDKATGAARGRAPLKARLAEIAELDPATLPYHEGIVTRVKAWRQAGHRTALVTAADQRIATSIAAHLGIFDDVQGSDSRTNLKGAAKTEWIHNTYGTGNYIYIGDSASDLAVWEGAAKAITINASRRTRAALEATDTPTEHVDGADWAPHLLRAMRPQQWLKNLLVCVPVVADPSLGPGALWPIFAAFIALSLAASAGYLINDLLDLQDDRSHPRKCKRPMACGDVSSDLATLAIPILLGGAVFFALLVSLQLTQVVLLYFVSTLAYSVSLKRHTLVDVCVLAFLFTLRVLAGGIAIGTGLSVWVLAFSMFLFFSLASVKRLAELTDSEVGGRETSRRGYRVGDRRVVSQMAVTSGYMAVLVLALYVDEPATQLKFSTPWLLWGVCPLLIYWVSRMVLVAERGKMDDDPLVYTLVNPTSQLVVAICCGLVAGAIWI